MKVANFVHSNADKISPSFYKSSGKYTEKYMIGNNFTNLGVNPMELAEGTLLTLEFDISLILSISSIIFLLF